jgi:predicted amidophosphoribosyltransferase
MTSKQYCAPGMPVPGSAHTSASSEGARPKIGECENCGKKLRNPKHRLCRECFQPGASRFRYGGA